MEKTALVLAGGGSRGAYQIGVWQALNELDVEIDIVTGTSVGALNAALITMGDIDKATYMWRNMKTTMVLDIDIDDDLPTEQKIKLILAKYFTKYIKVGGMDASPLKQLIDSVLDENVLRNSPIQCGIVVVDKRTLKPVERYIDEIEDGYIGDFLLASSSLYPAIKSCKIGDGDYIDGGYYDNLPVQLALKRGATKIIAVDLEAIGVKRTSILKKVSDLTIIKCYWDLGPLLVFDKEKTFKNIRLGYLDTMKTYGVFSGMAYTFVRDEISEFVRQNRKIIKTFNESMNLAYGVEFKNIKRDFFYLKLVQHIKAKYGIAYSNKFSVFFTACIEETGEIFEVDPQKIYTFDSFTAAISKKINAQEIPFISPLQNLNIKSALSLLDKKKRTVYLAYNLKRAIGDKLRIDPAFLAFFMPDEFLAAYYLAMIG